MTHLSCIKTVQRQKNFALITLSNSQSMLKNRRKKKFFTVFEERYACCSVEVVSSLSLFKRCCEKVLSHLQVLYIFCIISYSTFFKDQRTMAAFMLLFSPVLVPDHCHRGVFVYLVLEPLLCLHMTDNQFFSVFRHFATRRLQTYLSPFL